MRGKKISLFFLMNFFMGCTSVPVSMNDIAESKYVPKITAKDFNYDPYETPIAKTYAEELNQDKTISGAALIDDGLSAFIIRASFARMATKTIDLQTYIYSNDFTSKVLISELKNAADRGVKVRILLDDYGTSSDLVDVMLLDRHHNIEVKVFNVFKYRGSIVHYPQFLFDFNRLNSRMHNKLFIVDNICVITGGRNIGSNYFYPETSSNFSDVDVLFLGDMARQATTSFDEYWNYHRSIPASMFPSAKSEKRAKKLEKYLLDIQYESLENLDIYNNTILRAEQEYKNKRFDLFWGHGKMISDRPNKIEMTIKQKKNHENEILKTLYELWNNTDDNIYLSAAYFVPGKSGMEQLISEERKGTHITVVTNSLSSTNAPTVYAKWEKYRKKLIKNGVSVYEYMMSAENLRGKDNDQTRKRSSFSVLHSKSIVFDDEYSWIGSFNLDPRSAIYNTENVAIFNNKDFAKQVKEVISKDTKTSWHVTVENNKTRWTGNRPGDKEPQIYKKSPDTTIFRRCWKWILKIIPESLV